MWSSIVALRASLSSTPIATTIVTTPDWARATRIASLYASPRHRAAYAAKKRRCTLRAILHELRPNFELRPYETTAANAKGSHRARHLAHRFLTCVERRGAARAARAAVFVCKRRTPSRGEEPRRFLDALPHSAALRQHRSR